MTIGQLNEGLTAFAGALEGTIFDGTTFADNDMEKIGDILEHHGFARTGHHWVRDGVTGKRYQAYIFVTPVFYQRLKHLVADKIHGRAQGQVQTLTRLIGNLSTC
jgi:DNA-directed RNA polymerase beta subunit